MSSSRGRRRPHRYIRDAHSAGVVLRGSTRFPGLADAGDVAALSGRAVDRGQIRTRDTLLGTWRIRRIGSAALLLTPLGSRIESRRAYRRLVNLAPRSPGVLWPWEGPRLTQGTHSCPLESAAPASWSFRGGQKF